MVAYITDNILVGPVTYAGPIPNTFEQLSPV